MDFLVWENVLAPIERTANHNMMTTLILLTMGYAVGSLSSAIIVARVADLGDPRTQGSGNPGATNILRLGSRRLAAVVLLGDMLKGFLPVWLAWGVGADALVVAGVGLAAFLGHLYPVFFQFHGGKGVATGLGVLLGLSWSLALAVLTVWLFVFWRWRISSLSALCAAILAPLFSWWLVPEPAIRAVVIIVVLFLLWRHQDNIRRLLSGQESRLDKAS
jgi:glycerol-3-phosphate acyltransferase PlsY